MVIGSRPAPGDPRTVALTLSVCLVANFHMPTAAVETALNPEANIVALQEEEEEKQQKQEEEAAKLKVSYPHPTPTYPHPYLPPPLPTPTYCYSVAVHTGML